MAISPLMAWRAGYSGSVQALRVLNGTTLETTQLGAATGFTASGWDTAIAGCPRHNRIVEFRGDLYAYHSGGGPAIYKFVFGSKTWSSVDTLPNPPNAADDNTISGFEVIDVNGEARLYLFYRTSLSTNARVRWSNDGTTWNSGATTATTPNFYRTLVYQKKVYVFAGPNANPVLSYDPAADTWTSVPVVGTSLGRPAQVLINFKGRLLLIGAQNGTWASIMTFKELVGGGFNDVSYSGGSDPGDMVTVRAAANGTLAVFEENDKLYVLFNEKAVDNASVAAGQVRVSEFVPNGAAVGSSWQENDLTATVVPAAWRTGGAFANLFSPYAAFNGYVETSTPGAPEFYAWRHHTVNAVATSTFWTWNGNAALMTVVNSDVTSEVQIASGPNTTGEHIYTEGDFDVTLENAAVEPGKVLFDFQAHSPLDASSPTNKQGRLYYSIGGSDWAVATLSTDAPTVVSGGDAAPTISANLLQGIVVGSSKFRATWDAIADGFTDAGEQVELMLNVF